MQQNATSAYSHAAAGVLTGLAYALPLTSKEDPACGFEMRTKRFDVTPALLKRLRQPGADMAPSAAMTASMGAVTPGST